MLGLFESGCFNLFTKAVEFSYKFAVLCRSSDVVHIGLPLASFCRGFFKLTPRRQLQAYSASPASGSPLAFCGTSGLCSCSVCRRRWRRTSVSRLFPPLYAAVLGLMLTSFSAFLRIAELDVVFMPGFAWVSLSHMEFVRRVMGRGKCVGSFRRQNLYCKHELGGKARPFYVVDGLVMVCGVVASRNVLLDIAFLVYS